MQQPLTLTIVSPDTLKEAEPIKFNYEELKTALTNVATTYKGMTYNENELKQAKQDRATLRKLRNALDDKRKEVKSYCLKPYEDFEPKIKELTQLIDEPIALIDEQVKEYEQRTIQEKLAKAKEHYQEKAEALEIQEVASWEKLYDPKFENLSMSLAKITEQLDDQLTKIRHDWDIINRQDTEFSFEMKKEYLDTLDISQALAKQQELLMQKEEKAAYEKAMAAKKAKSQETRNAEIAKGTEVMAGPEEPEEPEAPQAAIATDAEKLYKVTFTAVGTKAQLMDLRGYMFEHEIQYKEAF